ncbi:hypothetical protein, partial [Solemya velum gill symbiont]
MKHRRKRITLESAKLAADSCETTVEFGKRFPSEYEWARLRGKLDEVRRNLVAPKTYWNEEKVRELALSCSSYREFSDGNKSAYTWVLRNNKLEWLKEIIQPQQ